MGLLTEIFLSRLKLPRDVHRYAFRRYADRIMIRFSDCAITFRELENRSYRLLQAWQDLGLKKGDVVFAQIPTGPSFFEIRTAAIESGIVLTVFHKLHSPDFIANAAKRASPKLFIVDPDFAPASGEAFTNIFADTPVWNTGPDREYEFEIATHSPAPSTEILSPSDPLLLGFTSGTTAPPKGLVSSHGATIASLKLVIRNLRIKPDRKKVDISLSAIPLVGAGSGLILPSMLSGGTLVVMDKYSPEALIGLVRTHTVTRLFLTPSQLIDLLDMPDSACRDLASVKHIIYGTSYMPAAKLEKALARFDADFQQGYGQAEVLPPVSLLSPEEHRRPNDSTPAPRNVLRSCGRVVKGVKVRIVALDGTEQSAGKIGEIHVLTPTRMQGYLDPAQNAGVILEGGWFRTGDHGFLDDAGYLHVIDREADIITTKNGPIYPRLIEEEAHDHPAVKECALVEHAGQLVLFVSLHRKYREHGSEEIAREIHAFLSNRLKPETMPHDIRILPEIPRSFLGKVMRREIRKRMNDGLDN